VNVGCQLEQPDSILNLYRSLLAYRRANRALQVGAYHPLDDVPEDCFVYLRETTDGNQVLVVLNFSSKAQQLHLNGLGKGNLVISTYLDRTGEVDLSSLPLRGDEGIMVELQS
jgi:alpha-glucosidase